MILSPMRFKNFGWPHNPRVYSITYERKIAVHKIPFGRHYLQSLGQTRRVMKGDGEFVGEGAYDTFKALASVFYEDTPGTLVHPVWVATTVWFVGLELRQEPRQDYVAYSFEFWEVLPDSGATGLTAVTVSNQTASADGGSVSDRASSGSTAPASQKEWYTVVKGDTLWGISRRYGMTLNRIISLNPQISNPNLIYPGQKVRIK